MDRTCAEFEEAKATHATLSAAMNESSLTSITNRLKQRDTALTSIDLRGKGRTGDCCSDTDADTPAVPRQKIRQFTSALKHILHPLCSIRTSDSCQLKFLAFHNHFLDPCEMPLLFDALQFISSSLDTLVLFHHDLGDEGVELLMQSLACNCNVGRTTEQSLALYDEESTSCIKSEGFLEERLERRNGESEINQKACGLKELYLSHCNISCKGATSIADALVLLSSSRGTNENKLKDLQVLSLGSNRIKGKGALSLAKAFGQYPSLHRLVLHGNKGILDAKSEGELNTPITRYAITPNGWRMPSSTETTPTTLAMSIFAPLILPYVQRRWDKDGVIIRPYDLLRRRLREEMLGKDSTFVDSQLNVMPDLFAWMGRVGTCFRQTNLHSHSFDLHGGMCHSTGGEQCRACATIHLNDLYELFIRMPHLISLFQSISTTAGR